MRSTTQIVCVLAVFCYCASVIAQVSGKNIDDATVVSTDCIQQEVGLQPKAATTFPEYLSEVITSHQENFWRHEPLHIQIEGSEWPSADEVKQDPYGLSDLSLGNQIGICKPIDVRFHPNAESAHGIEYVSVDAGVTHGSFLTLKSGIPAWVLKIAVSEGAAMRLHFTNFDLADGASMYWFSESGQFLGPYTNQGPLDTGDFWTHTLGGDSGFLMLLSVHSFSGRDIFNSRFDLDDVSIVCPGVDSPWSSEGDKVLSWCFRDATCITTTEFENIQCARNAVAFVTYVKGGLTYGASGSLINHDSRSSRNFFLTESGISTQSVANTMESFWDFKTTACNVGYTDYASTSSFQRTLGAQLLYSSINNGYSLLEFTSSLPEGRCKLGYYAGIPNSNSTLYRVSHPYCAQQSYTKHLTTTDARCTHLLPINTIYSTCVTGSVNPHSKGSPLTNSAGQIVGIMLDTCFVAGCGECSIGCYFTSVDIPFETIYREASYWFVPQPPANDGFAGAIVISGTSGRATGTNINATRESGEPNHAGITGDRSVWWRWTAPSNGTATFDTFGSNFDTLLAVYTGTAVNALTSVASNDDYSDSTQSRVSFTATSGVTYRVAVDGYGTSSGSVVLNWTLQAPPSSTYWLTLESGPSSGTGQIKVNSQLRELPTEEGFSAGSVVALEAQASAGYRFSHWSGALTGSANPTSITMSSNKTVTVNFVDAVPPVITLNGDAEITVPCNMDYEDAGATAVDNVDGDITNQIDVSGLPVSTNISGSYVVSYTVTDRAGNQSAAVIRTVVVECPDNEGEPDEGEPPLPDRYYRGDANLDGTVTLDDITYVLDMSSGAVSLPSDSPSWATADVNGDGRVNSDDALAIILFMRGGGLISARPERFRAESGGNQVTLFWDPVTHANLVGYAVFRRSEGSNVYVRIGTTAHTMFTDMDVETKRYSYYVASLDTFGNVGQASSDYSVLANTVRIWLPEVWAMPGTQVRIPINFGNARGISPKSMVFYLRYDSAVMTFNDIAKTVLTSGAEFHQEASEGLLRIVSVNEDSTIIPGEGRFLDLLFTVPSSAVAGRCVPLTLERATLMNTQDVIINTTWDNEQGKLCIGDRSMWGDVNADGKIDRSDAQMILDITVRKVEENAYHRMVGDLNGDGRLDSADAVLVLRMVEGQSINPSSRKTLGDARKAEVDIAVQLSPVRIAQQSRFSIPIKLDHASNLTGVDLVVSWPSAELKFEKAQFTDLFDTVNRTDQRKGCFRRDSNFDFGVKDGQGFVRLSACGLNPLEHGGPLDVVTLFFTALGKPTDANNPAPVIRVNYVDIKLPYGESHLWFGDVNLSEANAEVTILHTGKGLPTTASHMPPGLAKATGDEKEQEYSPAHQDPALGLEYDDKGSQRGYDDESSRELDLSDVDKSCSQEDAAASCIGKPSDSYCSKGCQAKRYRDYLGDWLLIGAALLTLSIMVRHNKR